MISNLVLMPQKKSFKISQIWQDLKLNYIPFQFYPVLRLVESEEKKKVEIDADSVRLMEGCGRRRGWRGDVRLQQRVR